jgi:hypothetical protein
VSWFLFHTKGSHWTHVMPRDDLREHEARVGCWCGPTADEEEPTILIHHAMDLREQYETGEREPS